MALIGPKLSGLAVDAIGYGDKAVALDKVFYYCGLMLVFYTVSAMLSYMLAVVMIRLEPEDYLHHAAADIRQVGEPADKLF